jgi:tRNA threonylcarbamoyladenosine modification (KEOPS) complex  Pcc1 subunit
MRAKATVRLKFSSDKHLEMVIKALGPETEKLATKRSRSVLERENAFLALRVEASDTVALRAALNSYLRWINSVANVLKTLEKAS